MLGLKKKTKKKGRSKKQRGYNSHEHSTALVLSLVFVSFAIIGYSFVQDFKVQNRGGVVEILSDARDFVRYHSVTIGS